MNTIPEQPAAGTATTNVAPAKAKAKVKAAAKPPAAASKPASKVAAPAATKAAAKAKPVAAAKAAAAEKSKAPLAKPSSKPTAAPLASASVKAAGKAGAAKVAQEGKHSGKKPKLVRDSFTFPAADYAWIGILKLRALKAGHEVKKSELLRAGLAALSELSDAALVKALDGIARLKTGRPAK